MATLFIQIKRMIQSELVQEKLNSGNLWVQGGSNFNFGLIQVSAIQENKASPVSQLIFVTTTGGQEQFPG